MLILHLLAAAYQRDDRVAARWAYSDVVNDGERVDHAEERGLFQPQAEMPESGSLRSPRAGRHRRSVSRLPLLAIAGIALLLGIALGWWVRPAPSEQLSAARAEIAQQSDQIRRLQRELSRVSPVARDIAAREQRLAGLRAALDAREAQLAQRERELAQSWTVPKPSAQQIERLFQGAVSWFKDASDTISRLFDGKGAPQSLSCRC